MWKFYLLIKDFVQIFKKYISMGWSANHAPCLPVSDLVYLTKGTYACIIDRSWLYGTRIKLKKNGLKFRIESAVSTKRLVNLMKMYEKVSQSFRFHWLDRKDHINTCITFQSCEPVQDVISFWHEYYNSSLIYRAHVLIPHTSIVKFRICPLSVTNSR